MISLSWGMAHSPTSSFRSDSEQASASKLNAFVLLLVFTGTLLAFSVEFVFIIDLFKTRMNTLFKFYYQTWALWSVASAYGLYYLLSSPSKIPWRWARSIFGMVAGILLGLGLLYPVLAIPTKIDPAVIPTLDGLQAAAQSPLYPNTADAYAAVLWLNQNVSGTPLVLETTDDDFTYHIARSRISAWTGLPTLLGWPYHEMQWRGNDTVQRQRLPDVELIYSTADSDTALALLQHYHVSYIYVGHNERKQYPAESLAKFDRMFPIVFQKGESKIYQVAIAR